MTRTRRFGSIPTLAALVGLMLSTGAQSSQAALITFVTPTGANIGGKPVNAEADFNLSDGQLSITLSNLQANPTNNIQTISDLSFTLSNGSLTGATSNSLTAPVNLITINSNHSTVSGTGTAGFVFSTPSSTVGLLDLLNGQGHAGPAHAIIGPAPYTAADSSIAGSGPHNPFIDQTATFTISGGITAATTVSTVTFSFGTTSGQNITVAVPEPSTIVLTLLSSLGTLGFVALHPHHRQTEEASA